MTVALKHSSGVALRMTHAHVHEAPRITVVHGTAPGCSWSWGYEAVINRLRLVYGDQIDIVLRLGCPYESWQQWLKDYEMTMSEALEWFDENAARMGVPLHRWTPETIPNDVLPASLAAVAAMRQGEAKARRYSRALTRIINVEGQDPGRDETLYRAAEEAGLDLARFKRDGADPTLIEEYGRLQQEPTPVHVGFYNVAVTDGHGRTVMLDYAFEPEIVEGAIEYLSGGALRKQVPRDVVGYLRETGWAPLAEVARIFGWDPAEATSVLERLEKEGSIERTQLARAPHWRATA